MRSLVLAAALATIIGPLQAKEASSSAGLHSAAEATKREQFVSNQGGEPRGRPAKTCIESRRSRGLPA